MFLCLCFSVFVFLPLFVSVSLSASPTSRLLVSLVDGFIFKFADAKCGRVVVDDSDREIMQENINQLLRWAEIWQRNKYEAEVFDLFAEKNKMFSKSKFYNKVSEHLDKK